MPCMRRAASGAGSWLYPALGVRPTSRGTIPADPGQAVFAAGDCVRGADLIVTAIADGREVAERVHEHLSALEAASAA
jgi:NADPH-dependent glutamate synthase beta subunit-like oxidoreductase